MEGERPNNAVEQSAARIRSLAPAHRGVGQVEDLQPEDQAQPVLDIFQELTANPSGSFDQEVAIDGDDLRDVGH